VRRLALCLLAPVLVVACVPTPPDAVRIGVVAALSGPRAHLGVDLLRGAELAVEDLNDDGGLLGREVELVVRDAADLVDLPGRLADLAERDHVTAVVGPDAPAVLLGARSPLSRRGVPALLPTAFAGDLEDAPAPVWRTVPGARAQSETVAGWLAGNRDVDEVAVLVADPVEGALVREDIESGLEAGGVRVVASVSTGGDEPDIGPAVARLRRAAGPVPAVVLWGPPAVAARATRAVRGQGWDVQIIVPASAFVGEYRSLAEGASEGVVLPFPFREEWFTRDTQDWLLRWHARYGIGALADLETLVLDLPVLGVAAYDAVQLVAAAVRDAGDRRPEVVAAALENVRHDGLLRDYDLSTPELWSVDDLYVARFHHYAAVYDVDPELDPERQRRFFDYQVRLEYVPAEALRGPAGDLIEQLIEERRADAPDYRPPEPPPGPVARPEASG
jgi:branched-chain amino acid transport system substrate-binding protein